MMSKPTKGSTPVPLMLSGKKRSSSRPHSSTSPPSSTITTPSSPSSNSALSPPIGLSPTRSTVKSFKLSRSSRSSTERACDIRLSVFTSMPLPPLTLLPPPPAGYWENRVSCPQVSQPADLATPVSIEFKTFTTGEMSRNSDSTEKREETPPLMLNPLYWDKVRASSDRATMWDQLKSSSVNEEM